MEHASRTPRDESPNHDRAVPSPLRRGLATVCVALLVAMAFAPAAGAVHLDAVQQPSVGDLPTADGGPTDARGLACKPSEDPNCGLWPGDVPEPCRWVNCDQGVPDGRLQACSEDGPGCDSGDDDDDGGPDDPAIDDLTVDSSASGCRGHWGQPPNRASPTERRAGDYVPSEANPVRDEVDWTRETGRDTAAPLTDPLDHIAAALGQDDVVSASTAIRILSLGVTAWETVGDKYDPPNRHWYVTCEHAEVTVSVRCRGDLAEEPRRCLWQADTKPAADDTNWEDLEGTDCTYNEVSLDHKFDCRTSFTVTKENAIAAHGRLTTDGAPLEAKVCLAPNSGPPVRALNRPKGDYWETGDLLRESAYEEAYASLTLDAAVQGQECPGNTGEIPWPEIEWGHTDRCDMHGPGGCFETHVMAYTWDPNDGQAPTWECVDSCKDLEDLLPVSPDGDPEDRQSATFRNFAGTSSQV